MLGIFFNATHYIAVLYVVIFGGSAVLLTLGRKLNVEFFESIIDKITETLDKKFVNSEAQQGRNLFYSSLKANSPGFETIAKRYRNYVNVVTTGTSKYNVAIDRFSSKGSRLFVVIYSLGYAVIPIILVLFFLSQYALNRYGKTFTELAFSTKAHTPLLYYLLILLMIVVPFWLLAKQMIMVVLATFGLVKANTADGAGYLPQARLKLFTTTTFNYLNEWISLLLSFCFYVSLFFIASGLLIGDWALPFYGAITAIGMKAATALVSRKTGFSVTEQGEVSIIERWGKKTRSILPAARG